MKITIEPTATIEMVNGTMCRLWTGETDKGVPMHAYIAVVQPQTHDAEAIADFERALIERQAESRQAVIFDTRFVI